VVLLHGVGADGEDLIGLAPPLAERLPHAAFVAPDAPEPCDMAPFGRQWFSLLDRRTEVLLAGVRGVAPTIDAFLDEELARLALTDAELAVIGFSQGTMTALHVVLRRPRPVAALVCFSGALLAPELLRDEIRSRPPVYLIHGELDQVVPVQAMPAAVTALQSADVPVRWSACPGLGHGIDPAMLGPVAAFLESGFTTPRQTP
jgi:phospholipase/carboxylesterase